ncbi:MAG: hypothetical protein ACR2LR_15215 [Hassallia sp.]
MALMVARVKTVLAWFMKSDRLSFLNNMSVNKQTTQQTIKALGRSTLTLINLYYRSCRHAQ